MFDGVADIVSLTPWTYLLIGALAAVDAVFPILPSESVVVVAASLAASRGTQPWILLVVAAVGALAGDVASFTLGHRARRHGKDPRDVEGRRGQALRWASDRLESDGERVIITARFVPGGRTAVTFAAGYLHHPTGRFLRADAIGAVLWAINGVTLGYVGGQVSGNPLIAMAAGLALALVVSTGLAFLRRRRRLESARRPARPTVSVGTGSHWPGASGHSARAGSHRSAGPRR